MLRSRNLIMGEQLKNTSLFETSPLVPSLNISSESFSSGAVEASSLSSSARDDMLPLIAALIFLALHLVFSPIRTTFHAYTREHSTTVL